MKGRSYLWETMARLIANEKLLLGQAGVRVIRLLQLYHQTAFSYYGLYFFTDVVGLSTFAGAMISLVLCGMRSQDPIVGGISDNLSWKAAGGVRSLSAWQSPSFSSVSCSLPTGGFSRLFLKVYFVIIILLYYTAQTVLDIPAPPLVQRMTLDYNREAPNLLLLRTILKRPQRFAIQPDADVGRILRRIVW